MARSGDVIDNPVTGEQIVFRQTSQDTRGELLSFELYFQPTGFVPATHIHSEQEERFEVVSGSVRYRLGPQEEDLAAGQTVALPRRIPHSLWNSGADRAHLLVEVRPALRMEFALETLFGLARDGKTNKKGTPNLLQGALLAKSYDLLLPSPPPTIQRAGIAVLAPLAKMLGYRAYYPKYSDPGEAS